MKMESDMTYTGSIANELAYMIYQVPETITSRSGYAVIEFSECMGDSALTFIETPENLNSKTLDYTTFTRFGRQIFVISLPRGGINALIRPKLYENSNEASKRVDFIIKVKHSYSPVIENSDYRL